MIHGARGAASGNATKTDPLSLWLQGLCARRNKNVAAVALANKTMRLAWVLLRREEDYDPLHGRDAARAGLKRAGAQAIYQ